METFAEEQVFHSLVFMLSWAWFLSSETLLVAPVEGGGRVHSHLQRHNFLLIKYVRVYVYSSAMFPALGSEIGGSLGSCWAGTSFCLLSQQFVFKTSLWSSKSSVFIFFE